MTYLEFNFKVAPVNLGSEILIAELGQIGFESFVENDTGFLAYIPKQDYKDTALEEVQLFNNPEFKISWKSKVIEQQNWNSQWEKNFDPIKVDNRCIVRAPFHEKEEVDYEIIIEPKMSFGTGHHETTHMMLQHILDIDFNNLSVLDMGCGTGILAILAEKRRAKTIDAIDIDNWCYLNSIENIERNNCTNITVFQGDANLLKTKKFDVIIANINRNILLQDIPTYVKCLTANGLLLLSGFYLKDLEMISQKCEAFGLKFEKKFKKNNWVAAKYVF